MIQSKAMPVLRGLAAASALLFALGACASLAGVEDGVLAHDAGSSGSSGSSAGGTGGSAAGGTAGTGASGGASGFGASGGSAGAAGNASGGSAGAGAVGGSGGGSTGSKYADAVLADQPLAYWRLNETSGTVAVDSAGDHDGLLKGGVKLGEPGALSESDPAMYFDGTTYVDVGDELDLAGGQTFTIEAWVYPQAGEGGYFGKAMYDQGYKGWFLADNDSTIQFVRDGSTVAVSVIPYTEYTHVVGTYDGLNLILYLNGAKAGSKVATNPVTDHPNPLLIGRVNGWNDFVGWIDEVAIYGSALSEERIKAHYDAAKSP